VIRKRSSFRYTAHFPSVTQHFSPLAYTATFKKRKKKSFFIENDILKLNVVLCHTLADLRNLQNLRNWCYLFDTEQEARSGLFLQDS
jgi:hypothetical protein